MLQIVSITLSKKIIYIVVLMITFQRFLHPVFASQINEKVEAKKAFHFAEINRWEDAYASISADNTILNKILRWMDYIRPETKAAFTDIAGFIRDNPTWPQLTVLVRNAENSVTASDSRKILQQWFNTYPPLTVNGKITWAQILSNTGSQNQAISIIRELWINSDLSLVQEKRILDIYGHYLRSEDHTARLDRLLWEHKVYAVQRMLPKVSLDWRLLAEARISLANNYQDALSRLSKIPYRLRNHPGLTYELIYWNRRRNLYREAISILLSASSSEIRADKFWKERSILARKALSIGQFKKAYTIVYQHGKLNLEQSSEAEWLGGWIALRWLQDAQLSYNHFIRMYSFLSNGNKESTALTNLPRAAYWAGRAAESIGRKNEAYIWYLRAASYSTSYYGQLSASRIDGAQKWNLEENPTPTVSEVEEFNRHELVRAATLLLYTDQQKALRSFILRLGELSQTPNQYVLVAKFAINAQRPDLAIILAHRSEKFGITLATLGYPVIAFRDVVTRAESALILAIILQESSFYANAISIAGARGLMQIMPLTAKQMALRKKLSFIEDKLTANSEYNIAIGTAFLEDLLSSFHGSYVLATAAYNAGYSRVETWIKDFGDPRASLEKSIDWIEAIPFKETRNYVQRVLENVQIYRRRLGCDAVFQSSFNK